ncbi:MAG TPA: hypothetical protein VI584_03130 [Nitrospiria bacterium]|nr:hypothetical protein [Nitrospiria bacterium]
MDKLFIVAAGLFIIIISCGNFADAQDARSNMPVPAAEIYKNMLAFAKNGEGSKVGKSLILLNPVILEINKRFCIKIESDINNALYKEDRMSITASVTKLIVIDIRNLFMESIESIDKDFDRMVLRIRIAFTEYQTIDPILEKKDFDASTKIKNNFRKAYFLSEGKKFNELKETLNEIEGLLKKNFPDAFEKDSCLKKSMPTGLPVDLPS